MWSEASPCSLSSVVDSPDEQSATRPSNCHTLNSVGIFLWNMYGLRLLRELHSVKFLFDVLVNILFWPFSNWGYEAMRSATCSCLALSPGSDFLVLSVIKTTPRFPEALHTFLWFRQPW